MKKLMMLLMLSCKKAAELIDKKSVTRLSIAEKMQLSLHVRMCNVCSAYETQSKVMDHFTHKIQSSGPTLKNLPGTTKKKIIRALEEK